MNHEDIQSQDPIQIIKNLRRKSKEKATYEISPAEAETKYLNFVRGKSWCGDVEIVRLHTGGHAVGLVIFDDLFTKEDARELCDWWEKDGPQSVPFTFSVTRSDYDYK